jgi:hypothetical protein
MCNESDRVLAIESTEGLQPRQALRAPRSLARKGMGFARAADVRCPANRLETLRPEALIAPQRSCSGARRRFANRAPGMRPLPSRGGRAPAGSTACPAPRLSKIRGIPDRQ